MSGQRLISLFGAVVFLLVALVALYRLLHWFPITIGGMHVGQTASFFTFVACAALSMALFGGAFIRSKSHRDTNLG